MAVTNTRIDGNPTQRRREFDACLLLALLFAGAAGAGQAWQPTETIEETAARYIEARAAGRDGDTKAVAGKLDARLRLKQCDSELEAFLRPGTSIRERTVVGVRCSGSQPWKVYIPVDLVVTAAVLVPRRSLPKGHIITAGDLVRDERDVSRQHAGFYTEPERLVGQRVRQPLVVGRIISPRMIEADMLIRRGQRVTLSAASSGVSIRMAGEALSDGALGQRIEVRNSNSGRIVEGIVRSREEVEILVARADGFF